MKAMEPTIRREVIDKLKLEFELQPIAQTEWLRKGTCPDCRGGKSKKKSLYANALNPWVVTCGRGKCGAQFHVKDLFPDLFEDWSNRAPATEQQPTASVDAYLSFNRGFDLNLIKGWYTQENFWDRDKGIGSATVRFPMPEGGYWERLIDRPSRFDRKAHFKKSYSYKGKLWVPPCLDLLEVSELWIVEGIFDAIALLHHGIAAVSMMSSAPFPEKALQELAAKRREAGGKLPHLVWALDNEPSAREGIRKYAPQARKMGFTCDAAQIPQRDRKIDWNDLHQRWMFIDDASERKERIERDLREARYQGSLLLAESAAEKGALMYEWSEYHEFHFGFENRLYWFKLDLEKFHKAMQQLEESERHEDKLLNDKQRRDKALRQCGAVAEIANCYPQALYFQRNELTDESWYYFRVDFPHDGASVKNTFTGAQVAAASEFKKRLLGMAAGAVFTGSGAQLDKIMRNQLYGLKTVQTIDYVGYSKEHGCYVFGDLAVRNGVLVEANAEDYFEFKTLRLKTLQKSIKIEINQDAGRYRAEWLDWLWTCFGTKGVVALAFWFGSLFAEQIRAEFQSFPFLEVTGEAGAGKSTLLTLLWKLLGRQDEEGDDPLKMTKAGLRRWLSQTAGMPIVMLEADRSDAEGGAGKAFDFDQFKPLFNGRGLGLTGVKNGGNDTNAPPFRSTLVFSQNASVAASEAILTRIVKLHFVRPEVTAASRAAADNLNHLNAEDVSYFLLQAVKAEGKALEVFRAQYRQHEMTLRALRDIRVERIIKNHAQMLALVDALALVVPLSKEQIQATRETLIQMALERQAAINADPAEVAEFWDVYDYLESLSEGPVVNHSKNPALIAINLNHFYELAAEHRQKLPEKTALQKVLSASRSRKFIESNRGVDSAVRTAEAARNSLYQKCMTVKCWMFQAD